MDNATHRPRAATSDGLTRGVELAHPGRREAGLTLWADEELSLCLMLFTGDALPDHRYRRALAVEPMTCPPNAFRTGSDLIRLEPGEAFTGSVGAHTLVTPAWQPVKPRLRPVRLLVAWTVNAAAVWVAS